MGTGEREMTSLIRRGAACAFMVLIAISTAARAQTPSQPATTQDAKPTLEIYEFGQADAIADFKQNNPDWGPNGMLFLRNTQVFWQPYQHGESNAAIAIAFDDLLTTDQFDLSGHVCGWGFGVSSNLKAGANDVLRLQAIYGEGIENYFNDAPVDVGVKRNPGNPVTPVTGDAVPVVGLVAYLDHTWNSISVNDVRLQFSFKYNFSYKVGGKS
jgi:hypothetical protein